MKNINTEEIVLVVDDDQTNLVLAHKILHHSYRIALANSGQAALKYLKHHSPDLILLDINMPQMDGFAVMEQMKKEGHGRVPVIFLTADNSIETETHCFTLGATDFVKKPFVPEVLQSRVRRTLELESYRAGLESMVEVKTRQVERITLQAIMAIANTIDAKDEYTKGHSVRVADYCALMGERIGFTSDEVQNMRYIALLHDIGKIGVPDSVLNKPGRLTDVEFELIKSHTIIGGEILKDITMVKNIAEGARYHHERFDGGGYPEGLSGEAIPIYARIIGIADAYDAMNSNRVYRSSMPEDYIRQELEKGRGTQFDPKILEEFLYLLDNGKIQRTAQDVAHEDKTLAEEGNKLLQRVLSDFSVQNSISQSQDYLTGLLDRKEGERRILSHMMEQDGTLALIDMDNLKQVNDIYGHLSGDFALKAAGAVLLEQGDQVIAARYGGDEFLCYIKTGNQKEAVVCVEHILQAFEKRRKENKILQGTSLSIGISTSTRGEAYEKILHNADRALYHVKQTGKGGYFFYTKTLQKPVNESSADLQILKNILLKEGEMKGVMNVQYREFSQICDYVNNLAKRYHYAMQLLMITLQNHDEEESQELEQQEILIEYLGTAIKESLRNVDISTRFSSMQYLIILTNATTDNVEMILQRIFQRFYKMLDGEKAELSYDFTEFYKVESRFEH